MKKLLLFAFVFFLFSMLAPQPARAAGHIYYVSITGNNLNPGTLANPFRTIQKAARVVTAGDTVYIRGGTYRERVVMQHSGKAGSLITFSAYPGETVTVDGSNITLPNDLAGLIEISGKSHIRVTGLRVINVGPYNDNAAILVSASSYITIEKNTTVNTKSSGVGVWGSQHIVVAGNSVTSAGTSGWQECITVAGTSNFEMRDNTVVNCQKEGICLKDGSSFGKAYRNVIDHPRAVGIYVDAWDKATHDITVSQNIAFDSIEKSGFSVASEMGGQLSNIRLENNIAYANQTYGIEVSYCCSATHPMNSIIIVNNTLYNNGVSWGGGIIADNAQAQNVIIRNNITSQNLTFQIAVAADVPPARVTVDHNLIDGYRGYADETRGLNYVEGNPRFVNAVLANFNLLLTSPAINAGSTLLAPARDFADHVRINGVDIGAYEYIPKQLIKNGGFNTYSTVTAKVPTNWMAVDFSAADGKDIIAANIREGSASVKITNITPVTKMLTQTLSTLNGEAGDPFVFSYWVKGSALPAAGLCQGQVLFYDSTTLKTTKTLPCGSTGAFAYVKKILSFAAPAAYTKVIIKFTYSKASGTVWFDLASLLR